MQLNFTTQYNPLYNLTSMDTLEQRITISPEVHQQAPKAPMLHLASLSRSSQPEKQSLLTKIKSLHSKNHELAEKQHVLQNTLNDLRKLLKTTATENEEYGRKIEEENAGLADKAARVRGALRAVHSVGRHLEACGLYWREFVE